MLIVSLYNTINRIFIGHILYMGSLALTSLGTVMPFITLTLASELLITYGVIANLSLKLGEKDSMMAEKFLNQIPILGLIISVILMMSYLINIVLDPIFILILHLGIKGAAIATVISYLFVFVYVCFYYTRGNSNLELHYLLVLLQR